ncbi:MAG: MBL fold metallo-hydrolase [Candidatus Methylacidiphilales bacterium]|nr:MBL fold metallo-hydrolase [Candidatus Methylacidiphilales bacterium]
MKIRLWGTRGSIPTPSTSSFVTSRYGGDTTCVSVESGDSMIIIDGGSGLRLLGLELARRKTPVHATFFFSHVHWDHIQGFPFFLPAFKPGNSFDLYGPRLNPTPGFVGGILEKALRGQQQDLNFPVELKDMPAKMNFRDLDPDSVVEIPTSIGKLVVSNGVLHHPGGCYGYRIEEHIAGQPVKIFAFATDTEHLDDLDPNVQKLIKDAGLILYDAQYTEDEYNGVGTISHKGWGHSTWQWGLKEGRTAGVKHILLHHHDPLHDDDAVSAIESAAKEAGAKLGIKVEAAVQGTEYVL